MRRLWLWPPLGAVVAGDTLSCVSRREQRAKWRDSTPAHPAFEEPHDWPHAAAFRRPQLRRKSLNFNYAIEVAEGNPRWKPLAVYDNGEKTFIRFDLRILHGESPAMFVMEPGEMQLVNYRVKQNPLRR